MRGQRWAADENRRPQVRRVLRWTIGGLALVVVIVGLVLAYETFQARGALTHVEDQAHDLRRNVAEGNVDAARSNLADLKDSTREADTHTDGPLWNAAAKTPFIGKNFAAVQNVSHALRAIAADGLPPLVDIADQVNADAFSPRDGRIDIRSIQSLSPGLQEADQALSQGWSELKAIDADALVGPLQGPVAKVQTQISDAHSTVGAGAKAAQLIPDMLGGSGPRTYLLVFQNNAEIRSTGGLPGAFAIMKASDGRMTLDGQGAGAEFASFRDLPIRTTADEKRLYSVLLTRFWADATLTPDFPRSAEIMRAMIRQDREQKSDGVISLDPIALSYILKGTGPVKLADGMSLTSENAVKRLLSDVYLDVPDKAQDAYFADAARRVFAAVVSGAGDSQAVIEGMAKSVGENRIMIESARGAEQRILEGSRIAGALAEDDGSTPHLGIFYNDATQAKLEYYLRKDTAVKATTCTRDGAQTLTTTTRLRSLAPKNARTLPGAIVGPGTGEKRGSFRMVMSYYAPHGGLLTHLEIDGKDQPLNRFEHNGINVVTVPVLLAPGQKMTVKASMFTGKDQRDDAVFTTTPGIESAPNNVAVPSACD
jgi:hypothetical protein